MLRTVHIHSNIAVCSRSDINSSFSNESEASESLRQAITMVSNSETDLTAVMLIIGGEISRMSNATSGVECGLIETVDESNGPPPLSWLAAFIVRMELWANSQGHLIAFYEMGHICIAALLHKVIYILPIDITVLLVIPQR
jgi:hypothetical protein